MSEEIKSVFSKIQKARCLLQEREVKKTGKNQNFNYYQLDDILPPINEICNEVGICPIVSFNREVASLTIYCNEGGGAIEFTAPMAAAKLPHGQEIQNLGASITYERRYLYMNAFEITEHDAIDQMTKEDHKKATKKKGINTSRHDMFCNEILDCDTTEKLYALHAKIEAEYTITKAITTEFEKRKVQIEEWNAFCEEVNSCNSEDELQFVSATVSNLTDNHKKILDQRNQLIESGEK